MKKTAHIGSKKGFTILYAVLIASLLLSIGVGIYNISIKDLLLSSSASASQIAVFASDSGLECALFWDLRGGVGASSIFATSSASTIYSGVADCGNNDIVSGVGIGDAPSVSAWTTDTPARTGNTATTIFTMSLENSACSQVSISKDSSSGTLHTIVDARGYNTCDTTNPRRVERGLELTY